MSTVTIASRLTAVRSMLTKIESMTTPETIKQAELLLSQENRGLEKRIETAKQELQTLEMQFGMVQYKIPKVTTSSVCNGEVTREPELHQIPTKPDSSVTTQPTTEKPPAVIASKPQSAGREKQASKGGKADTDQAAVDVGRLDFRVGRIVEVSKHPDADSLYVEKVDLGEGRLRTVVSGLVKFVPIEAMQNLVSVFLCNLKPAKMRGIESEAMLMCASAPEAGGVEPLSIASDQISLGEAVIVPGYECTPDPQLNPKKKVFETVKPFLRVDQSGLATYKGTPWTLRSAPTTVIRAPTLKDVQIA